MKTLPVLILACLFVQFGQAQRPLSHRAELSGTWVMDLSRSTPKPLYEEASMTIDYGDPILAIKTSSRSKNGVIKSEKKYYCDGRGEFDPVLELRSITQWQGEKLIISYQTTEFPAKRISDNMEVWSISDKGKKLTVKVFSQPAESDISSASVSKTAREVFLRVYRRA